jgi:hypothetical protein
MKNFELSLILKLRNKIKFVYFNLLCLCWSMIKIKGKVFHLTYYFSDIEVSIWSEYYWYPASLIAALGGAFGSVAWMRFPESIRQNFTSISRESQRKLFLYTSFYIRFRAFLIITRLNRIKKIDAHKNVTITSEKYLKLQEFWCISWPPENSDSREILIFSFRHFGSKFRESFTKVPGIFAMHFGSQP